MCSLPNFNILKVLDIIAVIYRLPTTGYRLHTSFTNINLLQHLKIEQPDVDVDGCIGETSRD